MDGYEDLPMAKAAESDPYADIPVAKKGLPKPVAATTDVLNRALVAGTLGAPVDIATMLMRPFGYKTEKPFLGSEYIGEKMEQAGMVSPTRRPVAELAAGLAPSVITGGAALARVPAGVIGRAVGNAPKRAAEAAKERVSGMFEQPMAQAEREAAKATRAIEQIQRQPTVSAERAARAPLTPEQQTATLQAQLREPVRETLGARRAEAEERAARTSGIAERAEQGVEEARQAVDRLEQSLLSRPTITSEEFGGLLRDTTKKLHQSLIQRRSEYSKLGEVISKAGDQPIVNTTSLVNKAQSLAEKTRNPQVLSMLGEIQSLAKTEDANVLTLQQADSLRKYLNKDIINKFFAQTGADKETLRTLRELRGSLIENTPQAYREALGRFRSASRDLDMVERQGSLKKILDVDPMSTAEKLTEAQVVGEIINKARAGNPVFTKLLESNPSIKEAGRLYFTKDLFGKDVVPTEAALRTWLRTNERPLRQLGLYEEFKDIRTAKETAQSAVEAAKTSAKAAKEISSQASKEAARAEKLSKVSSERLQSALGTAAFPTTKPGEALADALRRTRTGAKPAPLKTFVDTREKQQNLVEALTKLSSDVEAAKKVKDIQKSVSETAETLYKFGIIDNYGRRQLLNEVANIDNLVDAQNKARSIVKYTTLALGATYAGVRGVESAFYGR